MEDKYVPAGILVGGLALLLVSASFSSFGADKTKVSARLGALETALADAKGGEADAAARIAALSDEVTALTARLAEAETAASAGAEASAAAAGADMDAATAALREEIGALEAALGAAEAERATLAARLDAAETAAAGAADDVAAAIAAASAATETATAAATAAQPAAPQPPAPQPTAADAATAPPPLPDGVGFGPGETAVLADGALRVFVSRVDAGAGRARVSVNGGGLSEAALGDKIEESGACATVEAMGGRRIAFTDGCDAGPAPAAPTPADLARAEAEGYGPGETALPGDGAARVFVARVDAGAGAAWLAVDGLDVSAYAVGDRIDGTDGACAATLDAVIAGKALLDETCGVAPPSAEDAARAAESGAAAGETATLADGKLRIFVSRVDEAVGDARVAVNGLALRQVSLGDRIEAEGGDCAATVDAMAAGRILFGEECGGAAKAAGGAPASAEDVARAAAEGIGAGQTAILGDGAARVFVSRVDEAAGAARVAINGGGLSVLSVGDPVAGEDGACAGTLELVAGGRAVFADGC